MSQQAEIFISMHFWECLSRNVLKGTVFELMALSEIKVNGSSVGTRVLSTFFVKLSY